MCVRVCVLVWRVCLVFVYVRMSGISVYEYEYELSVCACVCAYECKHTRAHTLTRAQTHA